MLSNSHSIEYAPIWHEHSATCFTVETSPNHSYGVHVDGAAFIVVIPGQTLRKCCTRFEAENACRAAMLWSMACNELADEYEDDDRAYADRRFSDARERLERAV